MLKIINKASLTKSLFWSFLGKVSPQLLTPIITIYIARLLTPEVYGLIAIANIVIAFVNIFLKTGFTTALIQKQGSTKETYKNADFVFTFNLILSFVFFCLIYLLAPQVASFFKEQQAEHVIQVMAALLIINALGATQLAILQKFMDFKSIFYRQVIPILALLIVTLPLAIEGYGVWALVFGQLTSQVIASFVLWIKSDWKPRLNFNFSEYGDIMKFGSWVILEAFLAWSLVQGDSLIVGKYLSTRDLGLYRTGINFNTKILGFMMLPITPVFYAKFCSLVKPDEIKAYYKKTKEYISLFLFPVLFGIVLISPYFEHLILNDKWEGIGFVMAALVITGIGNFWILLTPLYRALGNPRIPFFILLCTAIIYIPIWFIFVQYGFDIFLISRVLMSVFAIAIYTFFENKLLNITLQKSFSFYYKPLIASLSMFLVGYVLQKYLLDAYTIFTFVLLIGISALTYIFIIRLISDIYFKVFNELIFSKITRKYSVVKNKLFG
jgi:O-antigen/teichoic acid export membrane protein